MKQVKCINAKNYKLTLNSNYLVQQDGNDFYRVTNDSGKLVRYSVDLFEDVVNEIVPPVPAPVVIPRTEQDCINSIVIDVNSDNNKDFTVFVKYKDLQNDEVSFSTTFCVSDSIISCGVREFDGLNNIFQYIISNVNNEDEDLDLLISEIFKRFLRELKSFLLEKKLNFRYMIFSTNFNNNFEDFYTLLNDLSNSSTTWESNPNSGNDIKVWILDIENM